MLLSTNSSDFNVADEVCLPLPIIRIIGAGIYDEDNGRIEG